MTKTQGGVRRRLSRKQINNKYTFREVQERACLLAPPSTKNSKYLFILILANTDYVGIKTMATFMQGRVGKRRLAFGRHSSATSFSCGWDMANHHRQGEQILGVLGATPWENVHKTRLRRRQ